MGAASRQKTKQTAAPARKDPPIPEWFYETSREFMDIKAHPEKYKKYTDIDELMADILAEADKDDV